MSSNALKNGISRLLVPSFILVSSIALLIIGIPRFLHELMLVPGTPILERINSGEIVSDDELTVLEQSRLNALDIVEVPEAYIDLGASYLTRARSSGEKEERQKYAIMSIDTSMKGLNMAPLNTYAWFRVATANVMLGPDRYEKALQAWRTSIATAQFDTFILIQRVHLGTILFRSMTPKDNDLLKEQLRLAYSWNRGKLRQYARQNNLIEWMMLLSDPESEMASYFSS